MKTARNLLGLRPKTFQRVNKQEMLRYLQELPSTKLILWCYLIWYFAIVSQYFDPAPGLWLSSLGISALIGFALNLAASTKGQTTDRWVVFRLFVFPFCVSSYSALIKGRGFFLLFPTHAKPLLIGVGSCAAFLGIVFLVRMLPRKQVPCETLES